MTGPSTDRAWPGTVIHRGSAPPAVAHLGLVETLVSLARCAPPHVAVPPVDQVLADGRASMSRLRAASGGGACWARVLDLTDRWAGSAMESCARVHLALAFGPLGVRVEAQVRLLGVGRVDLLIDGWLVVETDGSAFHADRASYREDRRRNTALSRNGYVWLRFTHEDVVGRPDPMVAQTLETWSRGRPPWWSDLHQG